MNVYHGTMPHAATIRMLVSFVTVLLFLSLACWLVARNLPLQTRGGQTARRLLRRMRGLWGVGLVFSAAMFTGKLGSLLVFGVSSFLLLRELVTITPTRRADHRVLSWAFFVILPLQYVILSIDWYGLFVVLIPVYAFLFIPIRIAAAQDSERFLERAAKVQWALMIGVYCVSYAPALLRLPFPEEPGAGARLLLFLCVVVQANDAVHELVDGLWGRHALVPGMDRERTVEGLIAGVVVGAGLGAILAGFTPMTLWFAVALAALVCMLGSGGQLCLSAIRRERGCDGIVVTRGRDGMMGRVISLCFAAPVYFHLVRFFVKGGPLGAF